MPAVAAAGGPSRVGKYELLMPLAAGGMARIFIGRSTGIGQFERHVVLKMIMPERANDLTAVNMFLDEARLAASLNHQNVAQVFEVGEEGGVHYLAMEYVHGQDLRALLAKAGSQGTRIPLELALTVVAGAAAGLNHAHERRAPDGTPLGIVHRDVSPSNIMIGYDGAVKLLDFGIAKAAQRSVETQSGIIKGKFAYMAPEQCRGRDVDRRSDVFSLGIILYEISTQHRCFRADSDFDTMHRIVTGDVVRPTRLVQGYPQALEAIVMKALATDAAQRYQSAGLLLEAIESFAVSSRMSLSTMGLGRFMRDMFGDVQEPWLDASMRMAAVTPPRENTISSTGGAAQRQQAVTTPIEHLASDGVVEEEGRFEPSAGNEAAATLVQMPSDSSDEDDEDAGETSIGIIENPMFAGGRASAPAPVQPRPSQAQPVHRGSQPIITPPATVAGGYNAPVRMTPMPQPAQVAAGTQPLPNDLPPSNQFPAQHTPGSGSSPAMSAVGSTPGTPGIVSTKHGYASPLSRADMSYPRYAPPPDAYAAGQDLRLKPNRRPLFIGLAIVAAGVIALAVTLGGSKDEPAAIEDKTASDPGSAKTDITAPPVGSDQVKAGSDVGSAKVATPNDNSNNNNNNADDDSMVSVIVHSEPPGADVLLAGTKIGVTPFEDKVKRGTKIVPLVVHKDGYTDFTGKIDTSGEYENRNIKLVAAGAGSGSAVPATDQDNKDKKPGAGSGSTTTNTGPKNTGPTNTGPKNTGPRNIGPRNTGPKNTGTKKCQPPGQVDPFSSLPVCK